MAEKYPQSSPIMDLYDCDGFPSLWIFGSLSYSRFLETVSFCGTALPRTPPLLLIGGAGLGLTVWD